MSDASDRPYPDVLDDLPLQRVGDDIDPFEFKGAVDALAEHLLASRRDPVARLNTVVSLEAEWGWGKTTFANLLVEAVLTGLRAEPGYDPKNQALPMRVDYNAWLSGPEDGRHWAAIAARVGRAFYLDLQQRVLAEAEQADGPVKLSLGDPLNPGGRIEVALPAREQVLDPRTTWTDIAWQLAEAMPRPSWDPCLALFADAPSKLPGRGFSGREARRTLVRLIADTALAGAKGDALAAAGAATRAGGQLAGAYADTKAPAAAESDEFVRHLDKLLAVLRPNAFGWRAVLVVEDVARLDETGLSSFLEALSYLRHLGSVLVLLCVDRRIADRVLVEYPASDGEGRLTKTIDLRQRVPAATWSHRYALIRAWCDSLGMPSSGDTARTLGRWCFEHSQHSPRQLKRLLRWLDVRLRGVPPDQRSAWPETVLLGAQLYRRDALGVAGEMVLADLGDASTVERLLLRLPLQPWDSRRWPELHKDARLVPTSATAKAWLGTLRRFGLVVHLVGPDHEETLAAERRVREGQQRHLDLLHRESPWVAHFHKVARLDPADAWDELHHGLRTLAQSDGKGSWQLVRALRAANVVAAMRRLDLHGTRPPATIAGLAGAWAQGHDLLSVVLDEKRGPVAEFGLLLLALLHGNLYEVAAAALPQAEGADVARRQAATQVAQVPELLLSAQRSGRTAT